MDVDEAQLNQLSDEELYNEARAFVQRHQPPEQSQLTGLVVFSRTWRELLDYVKHQAERSWAGRHEHYGPFYKALRRYLDDGKDGLRQRIRHEFTLLPAALNKQREQEVLTAWAQALAQEFIQHLVAEASLQAILGHKEE